MSNDLHPWEQERWTVRVLAGGKVAEYPPSTKADAFDLMTRLNARGVPPSSMIALSRSGRAWTIDPAEVGIACVVTHGQHNEEARQADACARSH